MLLRGSGRALVLGEVEPHPVADGEFGDAVADRVDHARPVLIGHDLVESERGRAAGAGLPVRGVDARDGHAHAHLSRAGRDGLALGEREDGGASGAGVDD